MMRRATIVAERLAGGLLMCALVGCSTSGALQTRMQREIEAAARPLLEMHPDANWTKCFNRLLELRPASGDYLATRPEMSRVAAPDDLRVMLPTSLLRLLIAPQSAPRLSVNCFETTLDLLHFEPKVRGRRLGDVCLSISGVPAAWHDLYAGEFDHALAETIDVEGDRLAMLRWWRGHRVESRSGLLRRPLQPRARYLWPLLSRRRADLWVYEVRPGVVLCAAPPADAALLRVRTYDYNLVRATCIWLASSESPEVQSGLIELVAHPSQVVAYNARFALARSWDPLIRQVMERYARVADSMRPILPVMIDTRAATEGRWFDTLRQRLPIDERGL